MGFDEFDFQILQKVSTWTIKDDRLIVPEPNQVSAKKLLKGADRFAVLAKNWDLRMALIDFPGAKRGYEILSGNLDDESCAQWVVSAAQESDFHQPQHSLSSEIDSNPNSLLVIPEQELNEQILQDSSRPTYVNRIFDQENLYANPAATSAQSGKPEFIGQNAYSLNDPDELDRRCDLLSNGEQLREYEYQAWRWYFDEDANRWRLKRMQFVSNFRRLERGINLGKFLQCNEPCWIGQVLVADELVRRAA